MHSRHRLALPVTVGASACSAADSAGGVAAIAAYDETGKVGDQPAVEEIVLAADALTMVTLNAPLAVTESDDRLPPRGLPTPARARTIAA